MLAVCERLGKFQSEVEENLTADDLAEWDVWFKMQQEAREREAKRHRNGGK